MTGELEHLLPMLEGKCRIGLFLDLRRELEGFGFYDEYVATRTEEELRACEAAVCCFGHEIAGWCGFEVRDDGDRWLFVSPLEVKEKYRRQGIGSHLLCIAESRGGLSGCEFAELSAVPRYEGFYLKRGYVRAPLGSDEWWMRKPLRRLQMEGNDD